MRFIIFFILSLILILNGRAGAQISGAVSDSASFAPLPLVNVFISEVHRGAQSDSLGRFQLQNLPPGKYVINFQRVGYKPRSKKIKIKQGKPLRLDMALSELPLQTSDITVETKRWVSPLSQPMMSDYSVNATEMINLPGNFEDPLKTVQELPGVISRADYTSNFFIRGAEPSEQAIVLDGLLLQNPYRGRALGFGSLSILNPDIIDKLDLTLAGFSAAYGNRTGALVDLKTKDGSSTWKNNLALNVLSARYSLTGPLRNNIKMIFSARRTYYDWLINKLTPEKVNYPHFYDLFGKITWNFSPGHVLRLVGMHGGEGTRLANVDRFSGHFYTHSTNRIFYGSLEGYFKNNLSYRILSAYQANSDSLSIFLNSGSKNNSFGKVDAEQMSGKAELSWEPNKKIAARSGIRLSEINQKANINTKFSDDKYVNGRSNYSYNILGAFIESQTQLFSSLTLKTGVRRDYSSLNRQTVTSPRFSFKWAFHPKWTVSGNKSIFYQFPEMTKSFNNRPAGRPGQAPKILSPQKSDYLAFSLNYQAHENLNFRLEAYERKTKQLQVEIVNKIYPYQEYIHLEDLGKRHSKGLDFIINYHTEKLKIQSAYSLSQTLFKRAPNSKWTFDYFDNTNWLNLKIEYLFNKNWKIHSTSRFGSGFPHYEMIGWSKTNTGTYLLIPTDKIIRSAYFRWDIRLSYTRAKWLAYLEVINLTNSRNFDQYLNYYYKNGSRYILQTDNVYMLPRLPVFGMQLNF